MTKNVLLIGSSGMIGSLLLNKCLASDRVDKLTSIVRKASGLKHPKLEEVVHTNFTDFSAVAECFKNQDIAHYCVGVYTGAVDRDTFKEITVNYSIAFGKELKRNSPKATLCFLSGQGADRTEKSKMMFAKDKGAAENALIGMELNQFYSFRPGYIYPVTPREEPNLTYKIMRLLYKPIHVIYANIGITSQDLANAMFKVGEEGFGKTILENNDIRKVAGL